MRLGVQYPIHAGGYLTAYNASGVNDTDWHSLSSDDFYDTQTGAQFASGLKFAYVEVVSSNTSTLSYVKLRAAAGAGDGVTNSDAVIPVFASFKVDAQALAKVVRASHQSHIRKPQTAQILSSCMPDSTIHKE
jgi:hypothetical protein